MHRYLLLPPISIHAPAEGATGSICGHDHRRAISIHAPAEGATLRRSRHDNERTDFNPRSRGGSDLHPQDAHHCTKISIHAPAEGATAPIHFIPMLCKISIHAPAKGATLIRERSGSGKHIFQSTLPRRERR